MQRDHVHLKHRFLRLAGRAGQHAPRTETGVVHEDRDGPGVDAGHHTVHVAAAGEICGQYLTRHAVRRRQLGAQRCQALAVAGHQNQILPCLGKPLREHAPDSGTRAGDQGDLARGRCSVHRAVG
jgi:hypothetical protein